MQEEHTPRRIPKRAPQRNLFGLYSKFRRITSHEPSRTDNLCAGNIFGQLNGQPIIFLRESDVICGKPITCKFSMTSDADSQLPINSIRRQGISHQSRTDAARRRGQAMQSTAKHVTMTSHLLTNNYPRSLPPPPLLLLLPRVFPRTPSSALALTHIHTQALAYAHTHT